MSSITLTHTITALPSTQYRGWRLTTSATEADDTNGIGGDDNNVFVIKVDKRTTGDIDVVSHVASLWEMNNLVSSKSDIPPKSNAFYRSSIAKIDFQSRAAVDEGIARINGDVTLLVSAAGNTTEEEEIEITI